MKCDKCGYDDNGTGDTAHVCGPIKLKLKHVELHERILQLAKQAGLKFPSEEALSPVEIKFAELIVQRCAELSDLAEDNDLHGSTIIKRHFGVDK